MLPLFHRDFGGAGKPPLVAIALLLGLPGIGSLQQLRAQDGAPVLLEGAQPATAFECAAFGEEIVREINAGNPGRVLELFDSREVIDRALRGVPPEMRARYRPLLGSSDELRVHTGMLFARIRWARLLRTEQVAGEQRALLRLVAQDGSVHYRALVVARWGRQPPCWVDAFMPVEGLTVSESMRAAVAALLSVDSSGLWAQITAQPAPSEEMVRQVIAAEEKVRQGKSAEAGRILESLPVAVRDSRPMFFRRFGVAAELGHAEATLVLDEWKRCFPDDCAPQLLGIDAALERKDYAGALNGLNLLQQAVGGDPYLDCVKARVIASAGRIDEARDLLRGRLAGAERVDDKAEFAAARLGIEVGAQNSAGLAAALEECERALPDLDLVWWLERVPQWAAARTSPEFERWRAQRTARIATAAPPAASEVELAALGGSVAAAINEGRFDDVAVLCDTEALIERATRTLGLSPSARAGVRLAYAKGVPKRSPLDWSGFVSARFLRIHECEGERCGVLRLVSPDGMVWYVALVPSRSADGRVGWADVYHFDRDALESASVRRALLPAILANEPEVRGRLTLEDRMFRDNLVALTEVDRLRIAGKEAAALRVWHELPGEVRRERMALILAFDAAMRLGLEEVSGVLDEWAGLRPGDAVLDFLQLNIAPLRREWNEALRSLGAVEEVVGPDPYLDYRKAVALLEKDDLDAARTAVTRALEHEPDLKPAHEVLWRIEAAARDFPAVSRALDVYAARFPGDNRIEKALASPSLERFVFSAEYRRWLNRQTEPKLRPDS